MNNFEEGRLLRIYIGETDRHEGIPLYEWIIRKAVEMGLAGATVLRGMEGFGAHGKIHTAKILVLSEELPIVVEIADKREKLEAFLPVLEEVIEGGMATLEKVDMRFFRKKPEKSLASG